MFCWVSLHNVLLVLRLICMQLIQQNLPPVRNKAKRKKKKIPEAENDDKQTVETRISSYDYRSWDKFDAVSSWILSSYTKVQNVCMYVWKLHFLCSGNTLQYMYYMYLNLVLTKQICKWICSFCNVVNVIRAKGFYFVYLDSFITMLGFSQDVYC